MTAAINPFVDVQVSIDGTKITVQYKIDPNFSGRGPFVFSLIAYQDESFTTPLYAITGTDFYITDDTSTRQNQLPSFLYKLQLTTADKKTYLSSFFGWHDSDSITRHKYLTANEISRRERVRFNYTGLYAYLLKRKAYDDTGNSPDVDPITGEPMVDNTSTFGVGAVGGYYNPVLTRLSIESREAKTVFDEGGRGSQFVEMVKTRSAGFPFIDQHDIVVTKDGKRFTVIEDNSKYFPGTTLILIQAPTLRLIPNTDTVYSIPIPDFPYER